MNSAARPITILMADDDPEDRMLAQEALEQARLANDLHFVEDGEELLDYLRRRNGYADESTSPRPGLILLDLNMPKMDGREALAGDSVGPRTPTYPGSCADHVSSGRRYLPHL